MNVLFLFCWWLDLNPGPLVSEATAFQLSHNHCPLSLQVFCVPCLFLTNTSLFLLFDLATSSCFTSSQTLSLPGLICLSVRLFSSKPSLASCPTPFICLLWKFAKYNLSNPLGKKNSFETVRKELTIIHVNNTVPGADVINKLSWSITLCGELKHSDWMLPVTWLAWTNKSALYPH